VLEPGVLGGSGFKIGFSLSLGGGLELAGFFASAGFALSGVENDFLGSAGLSCRGVPAALEGASLLLPSGFLSGELGLDGFAGLYVSAGLS